MQIFIIVFLTVAVYANTFLAGFVWDDNTFLNWPLIRSFDNMGFFLKGILPGPHEGDYRPLKGIILTIDYNLFGAQAWAYHLQGILIHLSTTILIYIFTRTIILQFLSWKETSLVAFLTALFFGIHPIHTEAVTFVSSSSDILGIVFLFISFYYYVRATQIGEKKTHMFLSLLFAFLAFATYEIALVLPILLIVYDICFKKKAAIRKKFFRYAGYFALIGFYIFIRYGILHVFDPKSYPGDTFFLTMLTMTKAFVLYIFLTIFPYGMSTNHMISGGIPALSYVDYNKGAVEAQALTDIYILGSILLLAVILIGAIVVYRKNPIFTFCILWFFISLAPVSNILPLNNFMSERYLYLASYGWCLLISYIIVRLYKKIHRLGKIGLIGVCLTFLVFYAAQTLLRNNDWKDSETFWTSLYKQMPRSVLANHNLGNVYQRNGQIQKAIQFYQVAASGNNKNISNVHLNLAQAYEKNKQIDEAVKEYDKAIYLNKGEYVAYLRLGSIYEKRNRLGKAKRYYKKALKENPIFMDALIALGNLYGRQEKYDEALMYFEKAISAYPNLAIAHLNLGLIYLKQQKIDDAKTELLRARKLDPKLTSIQKYLDRIEKYKSL